MSNITLWCLVEGEGNHFPVVTSCTTSIDDLIILIKKNKRKNLSKHRCIKSPTLEGVLFLVIYFDIMGDTTLPVDRCGL